MCGKAKGKSQTQTQEGRSLLLLRLPIIPVQRIEAREKKNFSFPAFRFPLPRATLLTNQQDQQKGKKEGGGKLPSDEILSIPLFFPPPGSLDIIHPATQLSLGLGGWEEEEEGRAIKCR